MWETRVALPPTSRSNEEGLNLVNQAIEVGKTCLRALALVHPQLYGLYHRDCLQVHGWSMTCHPATSAESADTDIIVALWGMVCEMYLE